MYSFRSCIEIIDINPFVFVPDRVLKKLFTQAQKEKGPIPVRGTIDGHTFIQTLVKFRGRWRLYVNTPMLKASRKKVGEHVSIQIAFDPVERVLQMPMQLRTALSRNKNAKKIFDALPPSRQKEISRYINSLKSEDAIKRNVAKAIRFLSGKERFVGREKP